MWKIQPTIIIKKISEGKYTWMLYLSNNRKRPTCVSPTTYKDAFKCRARAKEFASKIKGPLKVVDKFNPDALDVLVIDETRLSKEPYEYDAKDVTVGY